MDAVREFIKEIKLYAAALAKWLALAAVAGVMCGFIGSAFHISVGYVTALRGAHGWLLWLLPAHYAMLGGLAAGALLGALYTGRAHGAR